MKDKKVNDIKSKKIIKIRTPGVVRKNIDYKWVIIIVAWTFVLSVSFSYSSLNLMSRVSLPLAFLILAFIIFLHIIFDIIGIAVTASSETPFHSLASRKVNAANEAVWLIRNAEKVANFCNDVVGDITGIVSGASGAVIVGIILKMYPEVDVLIVTLLITGLIASVTVGGKAIGKTIGILHCNTIVFMAAQVIVYSKKLFFLRSNR